MHENHNYRMAALKLHGLHPSDRGWILSHFEPAQQKILGDLIKELDQLGLVPTSEIANAVASYPVGNFNLDAEVAAKINQADAETIGRVLSGLPERLQAMILHASRWNWASGVWMSLSQQERDRLLTHFEACKTIKPAVFWAISAAFATALKTTLPIDKANQVPARHSHSSELDA